MSKPTEEIQNEIHHLESEINTAVLRFTNKIGACNLSLSVKDMSKKHSVYYKVTATVKIKG